jgi:hypothetical protein
MDPTQLREQARYLRDMAERMDHAPRTADVLRQTADEFEIKAAAIEAEARRRPKAG